MLLSEFLKEHEKQCNQRIEEMTEFLSDGGASDWDEYKKTTGKIYGVRMSLAIVQGIIQNDEDETDGTEI